jgi:hypothetical protein
MKKKIYNNEDLIDDLVDDDIDDVMSDDNNVTESLLDDDDDDIYANVDGIADIEEDLIALDDAMPKKRKKNGAKKEDFYVEPKKFDEEIMHYYDSGVLSDNLADMVNKIAHKLSYASNFINYTYREDMVGDALIRMFKALMSKKYDRVKGTNPFSYFTRIAFNAFRNRIKKEKHLNETHLKYQEELSLIAENQNVYKNNKNLYSNDQR